MAKRLISIFSRGWAQKLLPTSSTKVSILYICIQSMYLIHYIMDLTVIVGWYRCCLGWSMWYSWTQERLFLWDWVDRTQQFTVPKSSKSMFLYAIALFSPLCTNILSPWLLFLLVFSRLTFAFGSISLSLSQRKKEILCVNFNWMDFVQISFL